MKNNARQTCAFNFASFTPSLKEVFRKRWKHVAPIKAVFIGGPSPDLIGSKPLLNGRNAPPQPAIEPQKIGPKMGKPNSDAGIASAAARVSFFTTNALWVSYMKMIKPYSVLNNFGTEVRI